MSGDRHLTRRTKRIVMDEWQDRLDTAPRTGRDFPGGHGGVDEAIVPWCERINALPGVVTLQSCAGHAPSEREGWYPACLWLWLSRTRSKALYADATRFAADLPAVERLSVFWQRDGQQVWDLRFDGPDRGHDLSETLGPLLFWLDAHPEPGVDIEGYPWDLKAKPDLCPTCGVDLTGMAAAGFTQTHRDPWQMHVIETEHGPIECINCGDRFPWKNYPCPAAIGATTAEVTA